MTIFMDKMRNDQLPVVLVHDKTENLLHFSDLLKQAGISPVVTLDDNRKVLPFLKENRVATVVLDLEMPFLEGRYLLGQIKQDHPQVPVIVAGWSDVEKAIECMRLGANDYIVRPVTIDRLLASLRRTLENVLLGIRFFPAMSALTLRTPGAFTNIVTASRKMLGLFKFIEVIADSPYPVLIQGETGVGKELVARAVHMAGGDNRPFISTNVAGLDDNMFSDTLFGHKKGAFTGAEIHRKGLISQAENGTLFLDEIGDLNMSSQVKLLRLIQEKEYYTLGDDHPKKTNARVICSTNHDLNKLVEKGTFRQDLYFRLNTHMIVVPPLRERREDIPPLLEHFLDESARAMKMRVPKVPPEVFTYFSTYDFPGNVRELQTMVVSAISRYHSGTLPLERLRKVVAARSISAPTGDTSSNGQSAEGFLATIPTLKQGEEFLIRKALEKAKGNQRVAASLLGITRQALNNRLVRGKKKKS